MGIHANNKQYANDCGDKAVLASGFHQRGANDGKWMHKDQCKSETAPSSIGMLGLLDFTVNNLSRAEAKNRSKRFCRALSKIDNQNAALMRQGCLVYTGKLSMILI